MRNGIRVAIVLIAGVAHVAPLPGASVGDRTGDLAGTSIGALMGSGAGSFAADSERSALKMPRADTASKLAEAPEWVRVHEWTQRPGAVVSALAVAWPVGSAADPIGREGALHVVLDALTQRVEQQFTTGAVRASFTVEPERATLVVQLRSGLEDQVLHYIGSWTTVGVPAERDLVAARDRWAERLVFERDSPVRDVHEAEAQLLYGSNDRRARPPGGTLSSVENLDAAALVEVVQATLGQGGAAVSVVAPTAVARPTPPTTDTPSTAADTSTSAVDAIATDTVAIATDVPDTGVLTTQAPLWQMGERRRITRDVTSHWVTVFWPVNPTSDAAAVEALVQELRYRLDSSPPDPGVFETQVQRVTHGRFEVIRMRRAVMPEFADQAETRMLSEVERLREPLDPLAFSVLRRRTRALVLRDEAAPEAQARAQALLLLHDRSVDPVEMRVQRLTPTLLSSTAKELGPPRVLSFGPALTSGGG